MLRPVLERGNNRKNHSECLFSLFVKWSAVFSKIFRQKYLIKNVIMMGIIIIIIKDNDLSVLMKKICNQIIWSQSQEP